MSSVNKLGLFVPAILLIWSLSPQPTYADGISVSWNGGTGNWSDTSNWTPATVPNNNAGTTYSVTIDAPSPAVTINAQNISIDSLAFSGGSLAVSPESTLNLTSGTSYIASFGSYGNQEGVLNNSGALNNYGELDSEQNGQIFNLAGGTITNYGRVSITEFSGSMENELGAQLNNKGQLFINDGSLLNYGTLNNTGTIRVNSLTSQPLENFGVLVNSGTLNVDFESYMDNYSSFTNSGTVTIESSNSGERGRFSTTTNYVQTAGNTVVNGILSASNGAIIDIRGGTLSGNGTINGAVVMGGTLSPGNSPGTLTINGNYTQMSGGTLLEELAGIIPGTEFDQLVVNGGVSLSGGLDVELLNDFAPSLGDSFTIMTYDSESGEFGWMDLPTLAEGEAWLVSYNPTDITLSVVTPEPSSLLLLVTGLMLLAAFTRVRMGRNAGRV